MRLVKFCQYFVPCSNSNFDRECIFIIIVTFYQHGQLGFFRSEVVFVISYRLVGIFLLGGKRVPSAVSSWTASLSSPSEVAR